MFCTKCGSGNVPDARFCVKCGGPISGSLPKPVMKRPGLITTIAVLHFVFDPILIIGAIAMMVSPAASSEDRIFGIVFGSVLLLMALAGFIGAVGMWKMKSFGRTIQVVLSAIGLLAIPIGTLISARPRRGTGRERRRVSGARCAPLRLTPPPVPAQGRGSFVALRAPRSAGILPAGTRVRTRMRMALRRAAETRNRARTPKSIGRTLCAPTPGSR